CMAALLLILDRFERTGRGLGLLPLLFALWINLHGSWVFGLIVLVAAGGCGLVEGAWGNLVASKWPPAELKKLATVGGACVLALFANPYGYKLVAYPFDLLLRQGSNIAHVTEWQSVDFHTAFGKLALFTIAVLLATAWLSRRSWKLQDVVLTLFALSVALTHQRFLFFAGMIIAPVLATHLPKPEAAGTQPTRPLFNAVLISCGLVLAIAAFPPRSRLEASINTQFPQAALQFMAEHRIKGRIFHYYDFGGYIEWNAPAVRTFADGRTDIFVYNGVFDDYLAATHGQRAFEVLDKYKINYVLMPPEKPLPYMLDHSPGWRVIYADPVAKLYERVEGRSTGSQPCAAAGL
ncbi:MAG TPA: hypothetical protein VE734_07965, partial [Terriglobales bacterium]|nr:hypothetical protein [Terriglobales bacterium]